MLITKLWAEMPGKFFCIAVKRLTPAGAVKFHEEFFSKEDFGRVRSFIRENSEYDIYFCPHGFNRRARQKTEAVLPDMLWADLDHADPTDGSMKPKPTIVIESSPGRYVGLWKLKSVMNEDLNRRLTYHLGADNSGWDITQLLRVPGTINYKYATQPRVRTIWTDGKTYSIKSIEKHLPPPEDSEDGENLSASDVFEAYQGKLPRWVRRELVAKQIIGRGDRSEMLWKLENACIEAGMSMEEAFAVIKNSGWNKFANRRNEDEQLKREIRKVVDQHFKAKPEGRDRLRRKSDAEESQDEKEPKFAFGMKMESMDDVKQEELDFIWYPYLAKGEVSILEGDPGLGKSYLAQMIAGSIATGRRIMSPKKGSKKVTGSVIYFDMENSAGSVTKPRLTQNGYTDFSGRYHVVQQPFGIDDPEALETIYEWCEEVKPVLLVFDTLNMYIGKADTHKASEVAQAFGIFMQLARDFNCAVLVLRHLTKGGGAAIYRGQGSVTFAGSARVVMSVGVDPEDTETRAMAITKMNFAKAPPALTFRIEGRPRGASEFIWGEFVNLSSQEIMDAASASREEGKQGQGIQDAMEFLEQTITGIAVELGKLYRMGEKRSVSRKMIDRASSKMNVSKVYKQKIEHWIIDKSKDDEE